jgi:hypothetical protein
MGGRSCLDSGRGSNDGNVLAVLLSLPSLEAKQSWSCPIARRTGAFEVIVGGVLVFLIGIWIGNW